MLWKNYLSKRIKESITLLKKELENTMFKVSQVVFKQFQHFMNYINHDKSKI